MGEITLALIVFPPKESVLFQLFTSWNSFSLFLFEIYTTWLKFISPENLDLWLFMTMESICKSSLEKFYISQVSTLPGRNHPLEEIIMGRKYSESLYY